VAEIKTQMFIGISQRVRPSERAFSSYILELV
jgi:hypothetical protein